MTGTETKYTIVFGTYSHLNSESMRRYANEKKDFMRVVVIDKEEEEENTQTRTGPDQFPHKVGAV
jgi:hypothetical protein